MHESIYKPKQTLFISKKLIRDSIIMAREQQVEALSSQNKANYMFYCGFESALKNISLFTEDKE